MTTVTTVLKFVEGLSWVFAALAFGLAISGKILRWRRWRREKAN